MNDITSRRVGTLLGLAALALLPLAHTHAEDEAQPSSEALSDTVAGPSLLKRNPFFTGDRPSQQAPARPTPAAVNAAERDLELRAFYEFNGTFNVSIHNRQTKQSTWLAPGESKNGILLRSFHPDNRQASVQFSGSSAQLRIKDPSDEPLPVVRGTPSAESGQPEQPRQVVPANPQGQPPAEGRPAVPRRRVILPQAPADT